MDRPRHVVLGRSPISSGDAHGGCNVGARDPDPAGERRMAKGTRLGRHVGILYCGIFNSSPSFLADSLATTPATVIFSASAIFTIGVLFSKMAVTNSFPR